MSRAELAARLLATFRAELREQVRVMNRELLALEASPSDPERVRALFRVAHTLKGASRAAGVASVEGTCHALESLLARARDAGEHPGERELALLFDAADALEEAADLLDSGRDPAGSALDRVHARLAAGATAGSGDSRPSPTGRPPPAARAARGPGDAWIRVPVEKLDALLAAGTDLLVSIGRPGTVADDLDSLHETVVGLGARWRRERRRIRASEGAAERAGGPASSRELEDALRRLERESARLAESARSGARVVERSVEAVVDRVADLRMRPFSEACEALPRAARDLALAAGKEVDLQVAGGEVEADRMVLDALREPLLHLVRNAVDHGIEPPAARVEAGKPERGTVRVEAELSGERLRVRMSDDGVGLDLDAVRSALRRWGREVPGDPRELARALLDAGVSTRSEATAVSGRGVGLDVVRAAVHELGGYVEVEWSEGGGATFTLETPLSLATTPALMVEVANHLVAIPMAYVERLVRVDLAELSLTEGRRALGTADGPVPVVSLARLLPPLAERSFGAGVLDLVVLRAGARRLAVAVDAPLDARRVAVRPVRAGGTERPEVRGAAILGSGRLALVADPPSLIAAGLGPEVGSGVAVSEEASEARPRQRILVVDDSLTTRTLERSVLEAAGYDVRTAVDGTDGWRALQDEPCDLVVADIEMPRMDGFALCEAIRSSRRHASLPVVLVTALETPEHRARGLEAGADAFIGKSSFDQRDLLDTVRQLLGEGEEA